MDRNYPRNKRCPYCGAVVNHDDPFCHVCLHEFEKADKDLPLSYGDFH